MVPPHSLLHLYLQSDVLPLFDYCDIVWSSCTQEESRRLKTLLNFVCKLVPHRSRDSSASAARSELNLTTLSLRTKLHMAQCMFRCLSSQSPSYLSNLFSSSSSSLTTCSSSTHLLNLPPVRTSYGQKAFSFAGASLWRTLPAHICTMNDPQSFNRLAKDFYHATQLLISYQILIICMKFVYSMSIDNFLLLYYDQH